MKSISRLSLLFLFASTISYAMELKKKAEQETAVIIAAQFSKEHEAIAKRRPITWHAGGDWIVGQKYSEDECLPLDQAQKKSALLLTKYFPAAITEKDLIRFESSVNDTLDRISWNYCGEVPHNFVYLVPFHIYLQSNIQVPFAHAKKQVKACLKLECQQQGMRGLFEILYSQAKEQLTMHEKNGFLPVALVKTIPEEILKSAQKSKNLSTIQE